MSFTAYIDGGARGNPGPAAAGVQIVDASGHVVFAGGLFLGHQTNNEAEYAGLLIALDLLQAAGARQVRIRSDSELLVRQMQGKYRVKAGNLKPLFERATDTLERFEQHQFEHVPRERNRDADGLVNQALDAVADVVPVDKLNLLSRIRRPAVVPTPGRTGSLFEQRSSATLPPTARPATSPSAYRENEPNCGETRVSGIAASVIKPPRPGICPARIRAGQVFQFSGTVPAGLCVHACAAMIDAVAALQSTPQDADGPLAPITATCQNPDCGAVFQLTASR